MIIVGLCLSGFLISLAPTRRRTYDALSDFNTMLDLAEKEPGQKSINLLVKEFFAALYDRPGIACFESLIVPCAVLMAKDQNVYAPLMIESFKNRYPLQAGPLIAIFLAAGLSDQALSAMHKIVTSYWASDQTTDQVITMVMMQLVIATSCNPQFFAKKTVDLFMTSPYNFCDKVYGYGGVLHLFIYFASCIREEDLPPFIAEALKCFASVLFERAKKERPELFTVKNDEGKTAQEVCIAAQKACSENSPHVKELLDQIGAAF